MCSPWGPGEPICFDRDEDVRPTLLEQLSKLRPAFKRQGSVTAGNASNTNDGASPCIGAGIGSALAIELLSAQLSGSQTCARPPGRS